MNIYKMKISAVIYEGSIKGKEKSWVDINISEVTVVAKNFDQAFKKAIKAEFKSYSFIDSEKDSDTFKQRRYWSYRDFDVISCERTASEIL